MLIFSYVAYERSYDRFHENADRVFRVQDEEYQNGRMVVPCAAAMPGVAPAMKREFPEVEQAGRLRKIELLLGNDIRNIRFNETGVYYADESILDIFHIPFVNGIAKTHFKSREKSLFLKKRHGNISELKILWAKR